MTETGDGRFLVVCLRGNGRTSNGSAIGARIRVVPRDEEGEAIPGLTQMRWVAGSISRGARSSLVQSVGLGPDAVTADVEVLWPRQGDLASRTELFSGVPVDRRIEIREDGGLLPFLPPQASASLPGGRETMLPLGTGMDPAPVFAIEEAPEWVSLLGAPGEQSLACRPASVPSEELFTVRLSAQHHGVPLSSSRQELTLHVLPGPRIFSIVRKGRRLLIEGENLPVEGVVVVVDNVPCPRVKAPKRRREPDGDATRLVAKIPKQLRRGFKKVPHVVVVEGASGVATAPFVLAPK